MKPTSWAALAASLVLIAGALWMVAAPRAPVSAEAQIRQTLRDVETAARARSVSGVLEAISGDYKDASGMNKDRLRLLLIQAQRQTQGVQYDVRMGTPRISQTPDKPDQAVVSVRFSVLQTPSGEVLWGGQDLIVVMRRESRRRWWVLSEDRWRVVSVANLPPLGMGEGGGGLGL